MIYLGLVAVMLLLALASKASWPLALPMASCMLATIVLEGIVAYQPMMIADALTFNAMVAVCCLKRRHVWSVVATALMGLSVFVHFAYYALGDQRFAFSEYHMYGLQIFYAASLAVLLIGGYDVRQFLASLLDRLRSVGRDGSGLGWAHRRADRSV